MQAREWRLRQTGPFDPGASDWPPLLRQVLAARGFASAAEAESFMALGLRDMRNPLLLPGMERAAGRVAAELAGGGRIAILGDYDVDGVVSTALLARFCEHVRPGSSEWFVPDRFEDGYGVPVRGLRQASERGCRLAVTVDCGSSAHQQLEEAGRLGLEVVVLDHHQADPGRPVPAVAEVNPSVKAGEYGFGQLAAGGLVFVFLVALKKIVGEIHGIPGDRLPDLRDQLPLVALATVADVVPLTGENRIFVRRGLDLFPSTGLTGLLALMEVAGVRPGKPVRTYDLGFKLGPRINAGGRLETAATAVELLLTDDPARARTLARQLDGLNTERQAEEARVLRQAERAVESGVSGFPAGGIVVAGDDWHPGVIGIVASRLAERHHRPAVVISTGAAPARGSCRSIPGFHLYRALSECAGVLERFGGHEGAAGLSIDAGRIPEFRERFNRLFAAWAGDPRRLLPETAVDAEAQLAEIDLPTVGLLERLEPFGPGNPEPVLLARGLTVERCDPAGERHLNLVLSSGGEKRGAIWWGGAGRPVGRGSRIDALFAPRRETFRGLESVRLHLRDVRPG